MDFPSSSRIPPALPRSYDFGVSSKAAWMIKVTTVLLKLSLLSFAALVTDSTKGAPPVVPIETRSTQIVREGTKSFRLDCPAEGDPPPLILWTKDGETVGAGWTRFKIVNNDRDLKIKNVELEDKGVYQCKAVNGFGSVDIRYDLQVIGKDEPMPEPGDYSDEDLPTLTDDNSSPDSRKSPYWLDQRSIEQLTQATLIKRIGSSLKLKCQAGGNPRPDVVWTKNGRIIDEGRNGKWSLQLKDLKESDSGKYTCKVVNIFGQINATYEILVFDGDTSPPEFDKSPINTTVHEGQTATFQCKVKSSVPPLIQWLKKVESQHDLPETEHHASNASALITVEGQKYIMLESMPHKTTKRPNNTFVNQLVIAAVSTKDTGWFICVVTNPAGHMLHRRAYLQVLKMYQRTPIGDKIPLHVLVGVPVAVVLLLAVGYAIWFLQRYQKKTAGLATAIICPRPPPPTFPPPSLPGSSQKSLAFAAKSKAELLQHHNNAKQYNDYHRHLDPLAAVPLRSAYSTERDIYEATPQPYELHYDHDRDEFSDSYTDLSSAPHRIQHYPSLYSCR